MAQDLRRVRALVAAVVTAQVLVPTAVLVMADPPARFGWQMYAVLSPELSATVIDDDGPQSLDLGPYVARLRPEVDYLRWLPAHLCDRVDVEQVEVQRGEDVEARSCGR